jgi:hypothetical protein
MYIVFVHYLQTYGSVIRNNCGGQLIAIPTKLIQLIEQQWQEQKYASRHNYLNGL